MSGRKILIITNRVPYPLKDGGNIAMHAMIDGYYRAGWQVHLLSMNTTRHKVKTDALGKIFSHLAGFSWVNVDTEVKASGALKNFLFSREPEHVQRFYDEEFRQKLISVLKEFEPEVVQVESVYMSSYMPDVHKHSSSVCVLRMHNVEYQIWQGMSGKAKNPIKKFYFDNLAERVRNYERKSWKEYDLLLAITEKDAQLVHRLEEVSNVVVAPFSIETDNIKPTDKEEQWHGFHIGAMDWLPNREGIRWFLHKVWPRVHRAVPGFRFYFAGRNMSTEFEESNLTGVVCAGEVEDADAFVADKKILIVPLLSGGGIRVKILEAMARGKIVISTSKGIKGIEARPEEHYLRAGSPEAFAKWIKWCIENKEDAQKIANNARALVMQKYDRKKVMKIVCEEVEYIIRIKRHH
jgi:glycosyltransferase involved in cell wall biosynthesis